MVLLFMMVVKRLNIPAILGNGVADFDFNTVVDVAKVNRKHLMYIQVLQVLQVL